MGINHLPHIPPKMCGPDSPIDWKYAETGVRQSKKKDGREETKPFDVSKVRTDGMTDT